MTSEDSRLAWIVRFERTAMIVRYLAYAVLAGAFLLGMMAGSMQNLAIVTILVLLHNLFVHGVLLTRRYHLFQTPPNFAIYFFEITLIVHFTGRDESPLYILFLFFLIGYTAYVSGFKNVAVASLLCTAAYLAIIGAEWWRVGIRLPGGIVLARLMSIPVCGWLLAELSELVRRIEDASRERIQALASSESTLRMILDTAGDPIFVYDEGELITDVNEKTCEFLGVPRDKLLGHQLQGFLFDDGTLPHKLEEVRERGAYDGEQIFLDAAGEERTVTFHIRSFTRNGRRFFVVIAHDITERKDIEEAARAANLDLAKLNRELRQVDEMRIAFIATESRKIQSPLCAILGLIDMIRADELGQTTPDQRKALQTCRNSIQRVFRLLNETFDVVSRARDTASAPARSTENED